MKISYKTVSFGWQSRMKVSNLTYCTDCLIGRLVNVVVYMGEGLGSNPASITLTLLVIDSPPIGLYTVCIDAIVSQGSANSLLLFLRV